MPVPAYTTTGAGPPVVLVHGVGLPGRAFSALAGLLRPWGTVIVPDRRGYDSSAGLAAATSIEEHADDIVGVLDECGLATATLVGVSGGATIALAAGIRHPTRVDGLVLHEPALGPLAPGLAAVLTRAAEQLGSTGDGVAFVQQLVGARTWARLEPELRATVGRHADAVAGEVPQFLAFAPTEVQLATLRERGIPIVTSHGALSGPERSEVAAVLATHAGARVERIDDAGNAAQLDAPASLAVLAREIALGPDPDTGRGLVGDAEPYPWPWDGSLHPRRMALVVAGADPRWAAGCENAAAVLRVIGDVAAATRSAGGLVVHLTHDARRARAASSDAPSEASRLAPSPLDLVVRAAGIDGFFGSDLDATLRRGGRDQLVLSGFGLETTVHSTLRSANDRGIECLTLTDACAPVDRACGDRALHTITMSGGIFGGIASSAALVATLTRPPSRAHSTR